MHLRRALLLFALVLGLTALATSIAPAPRSKSSSTPAAPPRTGATPGAATAPPGGTTLAFRFPPAKGRAPARAVASGRHVVITVASSAPGQASIPALGRVASVQPGTPASFDLLAPAAGRYDVVFEPASGGPGRRVGTLVTRP